MMQPALRDIQRALYGAALLLRRDPKGYAQFDLSARGFWQSFIAILISLPFLILILNNEHRYFSDGEVPALPIAVEVALFMVEWLIFVVVMAAVCRVFDFSRQFSTYIIAHNWASVLIIAALAMGYSLSGLNPNFAAGLIFVISLYALFYNGFIAYSAFKTSAVNAAMIVALEVGLGLVFQASIMQLI